MAVLVGHFKEKVCHGKELQKQQD